MSVADHPRVHGEDAVHVRVDLARAGSERRGERDRGRVGSAAAERGDVELGRHPLEPCHEDDPASVERVVDAPRAHLDDLRLAVHRVRHDAGLGTCKGDSVLSEVVDRHRYQGARDALADGEEHVQLARIRLRRDAVRELAQLVGRLPHRRDDPHHARAPRMGVHEPPSDALDPLRIAHRSASELHDDGAVEARAPVAPRRRGCLEA